MLDIPSLDGLRSISILIVFVSHAGYSQVPGGLGVSIFFVISGFLITTLLLRERDTTGAMSLKAFYLRRAFRILPIFYVVLTLALLAVTTGLVEGAFGRDATASQYLHYFNFFAITHDGYDIAPGTGVYWSLAIEEHFYVVFPLLMVYLHRRNLSDVQVGRLLLGGCAVVLAWRLILVYGLDAEPLRTYYGTDTRLDGLLFGCAAALIASPVRLPSDAGASNRAPWTGWGAGAAGVATIGATLALRDDGFRETLRYTVQSVAIVACMRYAIASAGSVPFRFLNARPIAWFGRMSYGFYLVHQVVIYGLEPHVGSTPVLLVCSLAIATLAAWALHVLVERPVGRLRNRVLAPAGPAPALVS